jgi:hypothetical protein
MVRQVATRNALPMRRWEVGHTNTCHSPPFEQVVEAADNGALKAS